MNEHTKDVDPTAPGLLGAVARGDVSAFEALYDRHSPLLYGVLLGSLEDAQEVLQETFAAAWANAAAFDPSRGREVAWLISMARSRAIDRLRSRKVRAERENDAGREISIHTSFVERETGADNAVRSEESTAVRGALAELPEAQRIALELAYFEGLSQSEIAQRLGQPLGTVKTRMQLGMKKLRDRLQAYR
ncbi:MAG: sigma-70 family RNA polymerase sigma factor [Acidobacteriota bacterium]